MKAARSVAARLTAYLATAYLTVGAFFYFQQAKLLFPAPKAYERKTPADSGLRFEDLTTAAMDPALRSVRMK
jgi:hypothetical protein